MKIKCDYCGAYINDTDEVCENCGAANQHLVRNAKGTPKTIEELKQWYVAHNLPDENTTRFFIGKDYKGARAFGIYKDELSGNFVVYKNKGDGSRAVRYEGKDEKYAVNELYLKLKEEIVNQKNINAQRRQNTSYKPRKHRMDSGTVMLIGYGTFFMLMMIMVLVLSYFTPNRGYYHYNDDYYYYQEGYWYMYNLDGWDRTEAPENLKDNFKDYYESSSFDSDYGTSDFSDSSWYIEPSSYDDDDDWGSWDSGSSWDSSDSWDSGSSNWDSDWLKLPISIQTMNIN